MINVKSIKDARNIKNVLLIRMNGANDIDVFTEGDLIPKTIPSNATEAIIKELKTNKKFDNLVSMSLKEIKKDIADKVVDLETAKDYISTLACAVSILAREL